ncbi:unannotated protein [freshwater metagenome]|uniref:Unannotated protein n=1 Tax=freshwater metagenome TaxID=449393 RepID=A0A6J5Z200_9ZZZZ
MAIADQSAYSAANLISASFATITGSFPPHSKTTGIIDSAQLAATFFAVLVEPVNEILFTLDCVKAFPVSGNPVTVVKMFSKGATWANESASHLPTPGVNSDGLKTTAFPAASA